jgi:hypothetical protein
MPRGAHDAIALGPPSVLSTWAFDLLREVCAPIPNRAAIRAIDREDPLEPDGDRVPLIYLSHFPSPPLVAECGQGTAPILLCLDDPVDSVRYLQQGGAIFRTGRSGGSRSPEWTCRRQPPCRRSSCRSSGCLLCIRIRKQVAVDLGYYFPNGLVPGFAGRPDGGRRHWHHSDGMQRNCNYASMLPWVDRIFRSHYLPKT